MTARTEFRVVEIGELGHPFEHGYRGFDMDDAIRSFERLKEMHPDRTFYLESREVEDWAIVPWYSKRPVKHDFGEDPG